ncbi:MAG: flippase [Nitrospinae bacterium]|nr:flippase [Nitrospinota bacterium]
MNRVTRNLAFKALTEIFSRALSFFFYMAMARWLGAEPFGLFSTLNSLAAIAVFLVDPGLNLLLVRNGARSPEYLEQAAGAALKLKLILSALTITLLILYGMAAGYEGGHMALLALMGVYMAGFSLMEYAGALFQARQELHVETFLLTIGKVAVTALAIVSMYLGAGLGPTLAVMATAQLAAVAWGFTWAMGRGIKLGGGWDLSLWGYMLKESAPLAAVTFLTIAFYRLDVAMAPLLGLTLADVGYYSAGIKILDVWLAAPTLIYSAVFPALSELAGRDRAAFRSWAWRSAMLVGLLGVIGASAGVALAGDIVRLIYTESFEPAISSLRWLLVASVAMFLRHALMMAFIIDGKARIAARLLSGAIVINILLNIFLAPAFSGTGMALAKLICDGALCAGFAYLWLSAGKEEAA